MSIITGVVIIRMVFYRKGWPLKRNQDIIWTNTPAIKTNWVSEINFGRHLLNRWHNIFKMILYLTLHKLIGLSSLILVSLFVLGIRHIFVIFNMASIFLVCRNVFTIYSISTFITTMYIGRKVILSHMVLEPSPNAS